MLSARTVKMDTLIVVNMLSSIALFFCNAAYNAGVSVYAQEWSEKSNTVWVYVCVYRLRREQNIPQKQCQYNTIFSETNIQAQVFLFKYIYIYIRNSRNQMFAMCHINISIAKF